MPEPLNTFMCESREFNGPACAVQCDRCKPKTVPATNERVHFRYIVCPECKHNLCWVNPRLPTYCPECGKHIYPAVRSAVYVSDINATLRYHAIVPHGRDVGRPPPVDVTEIPEANEEWFGKAKLKVPEDRPPLGTTGYFDYVLRTMKLR